MPSGISTSTGCENPAVITNWLPFRAKRYPTPTASNFFSKPSVTPIIALWRLALTVPCKFLIVSLSLVTIASVPWILTLIPFGTTTFNSPFGPATWTLPSPTVIVTEAGIVKNSKIKILEPSK